ncbi:MAG: hypothetical protein MJ252_25040, partial [archaeon]|nr:hypothetical protein [archaeon]
METYMGKDYSKFLTNGSNNTKPIQNTNSYDPSSNFIKLVDYQNYRNQNNINYNSQDNSNKSKYAFENIYDSRVDMSNFQNNSNISFLTNQSAIIKNTNKKTNSDTQNKIMTNKPKVKNIYEVDSDVYLNRRHMQELERIQKFKTERLKKEKEEFSFKPKINSKSKKIVKNLVKKEDNLLTYIQKQNSNTKSKIELIPNTKIEKSENIQPKTKYIQKKKPKEETANNIIENNVINNNHKENPILIENYNYYSKFLDNYPQQLEQNYPQIFEEPSPEYLQESYPEQIQPKCYQIEPKIYENFSNRIQQKEKSEETPKHNKVYSKKIFSPKGYKPNYKRNKTQNDECQLVYNIPNDYNTIVNEHSRESEFMT